MQLLPPGTNIGEPLMAALKERHSIRSFSDKELPLGVFSDLIWAGAGINRAASGKRTFPSARNDQEIDIYVAMKTGLYVYDPGSDFLSS